MTTTVTLPEPEITTPFSAYADERGRSRKATFWIDPKPTADGESARAVQLFVSHDKHRKQFYASLTPVTVEKRGAFTSEGFMLFSGARIAREPVARFSKKGVEEFLAKTLASLPAVIAEHPALAEMFTNHDEAAGRVL